MGHVKPRYFSELNETSVIFRSNDYCVEVDKLMPTKYSYWMPNAVLDKQVFSIFKSPE